MLELQRLLTASPASLPRRLIVDVGGILRHVQETAPGVWPVPELIEVSRRTRRDLLWVVASPSVPGTVTPGLLAEAARELGAAGVAHLALSATESLANMLLKAPRMRSIGVVTAGIDERPYELHLLDARVAAILDAGSGIVWDYASASAEHGEPALLPDAAAVLGAEPGEPAPGGPEAPRCRARILVQLAGGAASSLPVRVRAALAQRHARANELRGGTGLPDSGARELQRWLARTPGNKTVYVAARVERSGGMFKLLDVAVDVAGHVQRAAGGAAGDLLRNVTATNDATRWFAPRALDLLAAMVDANIALPNAVVDPAFVAYALQPGRKIDLVPAAPTAEALSTAVRLWMSDRTRAMPAPRSLGVLLDVLPDLDAELASAANDDGIVNLVENDLAVTLPVLARIERAGAWVGPPAFLGALRTELESRAISAERIAQGIGIDSVYTDSLADICSTLKETRGRKLIPSPYWDRSLTPGQEFERMVFFKVGEAVAIQEARALGRPGAIIDQARSFERCADGRVRGMSVPQWAGRWGMRDVALQNIPKRGHDGKRLRSALRGPPGEVLVQADQNGFEVRLLADLTGDAELCAAATHADVHAALAQRLSAIGTTTVTRSKAKKSVLAIMYGQTVDSFWRNEAAMPISDARALFTNTQKLLQGVNQWQARVNHQLKKRGYVTTRGGWRLLPVLSKSASAKRRSILNGLVQGLGADIQRWVLRRLETVLPPQARIVRQTHDDIVVACPLVMALYVEELLVTAMTQDVMTMSGLLQRGVPLVAVPTQGATWGDLV